MRVPREDTKTVHRDVRRCDIRIKRQRQTENTSVETPLTLGHLKVTGRVKMTNSSDQFPCYPFVPDESLLLNMNKAFIFWEHELIAANRVKIDPVVPELTRRDSQTDKCESIEWLPPNFQLMVY